MAKGLQRKRQRQQQAAELAQLRTIVAHAAPRQAFALPPVHRRPEQLQWDWQCGTCGHLNYAGRSLCHQHLCIGPRSKGLTMVGSIRGITQTSSAAQTARQQQLQTMSLPSAYQVVAERPRVGNINSATPHSHNGVVSQPPHQNQQQQQAQKKQQQVQQQAPARRVRQPAKTVDTVRQGSAAGNAAGASAKDLCDQPRTFAQLAEAENEVADDEVEEDEEADDNATDFEDLDADPLVLRKRHIKLARVLERRQKRLANERVRIEEQANEIAAQQAKMVVLQSAADSTAQEIVSVQGKISAICQQIARIEAQKSKDTLSTPPVAAAPVDNGLTPEQHARDCLERTVVAFQHFQGQAPEVQCLLQQFTAIFDAMRAAEAVVDKKQPTLEQVFARTANPQQPAAAPTPLASHPPVGDAAHGELQPQAFDIASEVSAASAAETGPEAIRVDGHNVGEKRKQEHLQDAERISREEAGVKESKDDVSVSAQPVQEQSKSANPTAVQEGGIEVDAEGHRATPTPVQTEAFPKSYAKRTDMLDQLQAQAVKQAAAVRQRASPYGHG